MYLSRVLLNKRKRETLRAIGSPQVIHGAVESSFIRESDSRRDNRRLLWRIDCVGEQYYLILLSEEVPNLTSIVQQFGFPDLYPGGETKLYLPLLDKLRNGQQWQFRLCANPVHSSSKEVDERTGRGKLYAHVTTEQQKNWLLARSTAYGFEIKPSQFDVINSAWKKFRKANTGNHEVILRTVIFDGVLTVIDVEHFKKSLIHGIGRAKAYGCGLLTIMRPPGGYE